MADDGLHWFVAYVKPFFEKKAAQALDSLGVEYFLPLRKTKRQWSDRVKVIDKVLIPRMIFIHSTLAGRIEPLKVISCIRGYMTKSGSSTPAIIPDNQMRDFMFVVSNWDDEIKLDTAGFACGDHVRIISGSLKGLECELVEVSGKSLVAVDVTHVGKITIEIKRSMVEKID